MTRPDPAGRGERGHLLSYLLAALGILTSLSLGVGMLTLGLPPVEQDNQAPSVSVEETDTGPGADTPKPEAAPGYDPRQANLVAAEDERLFAIVGQIQPGATVFQVPIGNQPPTVVLPARPAAYDLPALVSAGAVVTQPDGTMLLQRSVLVGPGAQLRISSPGTTLRMSSGPQGFTSVVAFKGSVTLEGGSDGAPLSLTSWDPTKNAPDTEPGDGRAYVRSVGGRMDLHFVHTADLGFWSGRTGGVAWTGSAAEVATGSARDVSFVGNHYGVFSSRSKGLLINGGMVKGSAMDGIAVYRESEATEVWRLTASGNARNGVAVSRGAKNVSIREVTATGNARNGIFLDGTPLATGPNAGGVATNAANGFLVDGSTARGNAEHGILVARANAAELTRNNVEANRDGVVVRGATQGVALRENHVSAPGGFAVAIRDGARDAVVDKNVITDALTAVQVDNAVARVSGNEIAQMTLHGVSVIGISSGSSVTDNRMAGRGPSSVDLNRLAFNNLVDVSRNDESNWVVDRNDAQYLANFVRKHPPILLWFLTLVFPLAATVYYRRRRNRDGPGQHPYRRTAARRPATAAPAATNGRAPGRVPVQGRRLTSTRPAGGEASNRVRNNVESRHGPARNDPSRGGPRGPGPPGPRRPDPPPGGDGTRVTVVSPP